MKKILMLLEKPFPEDERVEKEALALIKAGYSVHIASMCDDGAAASGEYKGIFVHRKAIGPWLKKTSVGALKAPFYFNFWRGFVREICTRERFGFIHVHDLPLAQVGLEAGKQYGMKYVLDLHEHWPALLEVSPHTQSLLGRLLSNNRQWENYEAEMVQLADHVIVVIEEAAERLQRLGLSPAKVTVVSNTIPLEELELSQAAAKPPGEAILGYAGGIQYLRGIQHVIAAMPRIVAQRPGAKLWLIGNGRHVPVLKEMCKGGVEEHVLFFGHLGYREMMEKINQFDIGLIPHLKIPLTDSTIPNKLFQYMYLQKPVLTSNCLPLERIVRETRSGLVYTYDDPEEFAGRALEILTDREMAAAFGRNGKAAVETKYNWARDAEALAQMYERIA